jgi:NitT/TauT family transport system substrate-binding protein
VTPEKLQGTIDAVTAAYQLPATPDPATVFTEQYLPPLAERMLPKSAN